MGKRGREADDGYVKAARLVRAPVCPAPQLAPTESARYNTPPQVFQSDGQVRVDAAWTQAGEPGVNKRSALQAIRRHIRNMQSVLLLRCQRSQEKCPNQTAMRYRSRQ